MKRADCRICGIGLHKPGGYSLMVVGPGFCKKCVCSVLRRLLK